MTTTKPRALAIIVTAALAGIGLTGCVFTPMAAHAPTETTTPAETTTQEQAPQEQPVALSDEDRYLEAAMDGITYGSIPGNVEDMIVDMGYLTCEAWDEGASRSALIAVVDSGLGNSIGFTSDAAAVFVDAALTHLC